MIVDSHHHLWDLSQVDYPWLKAKGVRRFFGDPSSIQENYLPEDFRADWGGIKVSGSVHIQVGAGPAQEFAETAWLDSQAKKSGLPSAIVAFADLTSEQLPDNLDKQLACSGLVRGIRQIVSRHKNEDGPKDGLSILRNPKFGRGLAVLARRGLSFDLQLTPPLLPTAAETFAAVPNLKVALCHAGSPWDRDQGSFDEWTSGLEKFAQVPNATCKLSGLGMFDPEWTKDSLAPVIHAVLQTFGPERVMWGSNFPVDKLYRDYRYLFETVWARVPTAWRRKVFGENAARFYRLEFLTQAGRSAFDQRSSEAPDLRRQ